ncbi:MAG: Trk family potassium uptake protein, partial [Chloroflexi bacterium]|nr:Trk family potassium uptake protein [Chloroflexota bacterium]
VPQKMVHAFYISANARTAGFSSLNLGSFAFQTLSLVMILMFIGGVAGSTAGGIKVNTFATLLVTVRSYVMGNSHVRIFGRVIPEQRVHEAIAGLFLSACVVGLPFLILTFTESLPKLDLLFESVSAFGTVGLTTGITPSLSVAGRVVVAISMFVGRLGPLTMLLAVTERHVPVEDFEPEDRA